MVVLLFHPPTTLCSKLSNNFASAAGGGAYQFFWGAGMHVVLDLKEVFVIDALAHIKGYHQFFTTLQTIAFKTSF